MTGVRISTVCSTIREIIGSAAGDDRSAPRAKMPSSADDQKESFQMIIEDTLGEEGDYETVRNIHETLNDLIEHKEEPEPLALDMRR